MIYEFINWHNGTMEHWLSNVRVSWSYFIGLDLGVFIIWQECEKYLLVIAETFLCYFQTAGHNKVQTTVLQIRNRGHCQIVYWLSKYLGNSYQSSSVTADFYKFSSRSHVDCKQVVRRRFLITSQSKDAQCSVPKLTTVKLTNWHQFLMRLLLIVIDHQFRRNIVKVAIDPLHKWRLDLNNNTWYILSLILMFQDKGFFSWMRG